MTARIQIAVPPRHDRNASPASTTAPRRARSRWRLALLLLAAAAASACTAGEMRGPLRLARMPAAATDTVASARLWDMSEALAGVRFADAAR